MARSARLRSAVSLTDPLIQAAPTGGTISVPPTGGPGARLQALAERIDTRRNGLIALAMLVALALFAYFFRPTYPNYDSYYTLLWGEDLLGGDLPDYDVFRPPTPHALATWVAALLAIFDGISDRLLVAISVASYIALVVILFRFTQQLLGTLVALAATLFVLSRTDLQFLALRGTVDLPFLALVFGAALLELKTPRRGTAVLVLLGLAGLLRPEAWVFAGLYFLWLASATKDRGELIRYAALTAAAPLIWVAWDLIVTGEPLYSLTQTRDVASQVERNRGLVDAVTLIPDFIGGSEKVVTLVAGGLGSLVALYLLRRRAALPVALLVIGTGIFLMIAAAGLSVIPRYMLIPSLVVTLCIGVALSGWTLVAERRMRWVAIAIAIVSAATIAYRLPDFKTDFRVLGNQANFVEEQHHTFQDVVNDPELARYLDKRTCNPITLPTHSSIPVLRYETGLPKQRIRASIEQSRAPKHGVQFVSRTFNFEPAAARSVITISSGARSAERYWSNHPNPLFLPVAGNYRWRALVDC